MITSNQRQFFAFTKLSPARKFAGGIRELEQALRLQYTAEI